MHATRKVKLKDISPNLICNLCGGYFIDATTIVECIHSFCRSCIVKHLEKCDYCPVCEVQLHSSKPLSSIRPDQMLQEVVYKLVPGLFQSEMSNRRKFYEHSESQPRSQQDGGQVFNESYITSDDMIHLSLEFDTADVKLRDSTKRFILCPAAVSIAVLKKLIQGKYDLKNRSCIEIKYRERSLPDDFLLMDIAYKYSWSQNGNGPLQLHYRVIGEPCVRSPFRCKSLHPLQLIRKLNYRQSPLGISAEDDKKLVSLLSNSHSKKICKGKSITPSGKPRGRPKRIRTISSEEETAAKKPKNINSRKSKILKLKEWKYINKQAIEAEMANRNQAMDVGMPSQNQGIEVQLRISENGVISAKSVSSGEERIINPPVSTPPKNSGRDATIMNSKIPIRQDQSLTSTLFGYEAFPEQESPISLTKNDTQNGGYEAERFNIYKGNGLSISEKLNNRNTNDTPLPAHHTLKVPTPSKSSNSNGNNNRGIHSVTSKHSPVKDNLESFSKKAPSSCKKPLKFFKSRIADSNTGNSEHFNSNDRVEPRSTHEKPSERIPATTLSNTPPLSSDTAEKDAESASNFLKNSPEELHDGVRSNGLKRKEDDEVSTSEKMQEPSPEIDQLSHHHQFSGHGFHLDSNMNMGSMGLPMHFLPSLTNSYCSFPFFPNPNPINPLWAMAMTMNLNQSLAPFAYENNNSSPATNFLNGVPGSHKSPKGNGNAGNIFLDLSKKSKSINSSGFLPVSPKKSHAKKAKKDKSEESNPVPSSMATSSQCVSPTSPKKASIKHSTPKLSNTVTSVSNGSDEPKTVADADKLEAQECIDRGFEIQVPRMHDEAVPASPSRNELCMDLGANQNETLSSTSENDEILKNAKDLEPGSDSSDGDKLVAGNEAQTVKSGDDGKLEMTTTLESSPRMEESPLPLPGTPTPATVPSVNGDDPIKAAEPTAEASTLLPDNKSPTFNNNNLNDPPQTPTTCGSIISTSASTTTTYSA